MFSASNSNGIYIVSKHFVNIVEKYTYGRVVVIGISVLRRISHLRYRALNAQLHTTKSESDLRELDEVNVRRAVRLTACRDVPRSVRANDMVIGMMMYTEDVD